MFSGGPLAYKSKIQPSVSTSSTTKAEYLAVLVHAAKIAKYLRSIRAELGYYEQHKPTSHAL